MSFVVVGVLTISVSCPVARVAATGVVTSVQWSEECVERSSPRTVHMTCVAGCDDQTGHTQCTRPLPDNPGPDGVVGIYNAGPVYAPPRASAELTTAESLDSRRWHARSYYSEGSEALASVPWS